MNYHTDATLRLRQCLAERQRTATRGAYIIYDDGQTQGVRHSDNDSYVTVAAIMDGFDPAQSGDVTDAYRANMSGTTGNAAPVPTGPRQGFNV